MTVTTALGDTVPECPTSAASWSCSRGAYGVMVIQARQHRHAAAQAHMERGQRLLHQPEQHAPTQPCNAARKMACACHTLCRTMPQPLRMMLHRQGPWEKKQRTIVEQELVTMRANRLSRVTQQDTPMKPRYPVNRACSVQCKRGTLFMPIKFSDN
jgi:hypothetical protein